jgi:bacillopeptidase F (M6 metalloprotease family)
LWEDLYSNYDWAEVWVAGKAVSQICPGTYAKPTKWVKRTVDLTAHVGKTVEVAFHMMASTQQNYAGWYIDDLEVTGGP